jgi:hypothetical protein
MPQKSRLTPCAIRIYLAKRMYIASSLHPIMKLSQFKGTITVLIAEKRECPSGQRGKA